jgi:hypothetical protein
VFTGKIEGGLPNGQGLVKYPNSDVYDGALKDGVRHGHGKCLFANGESFDGLWIDDAMHVGKLVLPGGIVQEIDESERQEM